MDKPAWPARPASPTGQVFAWLSHASNGEGLLDHHFLKLHSDKTVTWDHNKSPTGQWYYMYDEKTDSGYMIIEFSQNPHYTQTRGWKRHFLEQLDSDNFELVSKEHEIYDMADIDGCPFWRTSEATRHNNDSKVTMMKVGCMRDTFRK